MPSTKVLIIGEDPSYLGRLKEELVRDIDGLTVHTSPTRSVLDKVKGGDYDGLISIYDASTERGMKVLKEVRELGIDLPFIFLTDQVTDDFARKAVDAGADCFLKRVDDPKLNSRCLARALKKERKLNKTTKIEKQYQKIKLLFESVMDFVEMTPESVLFDMIADHLRKITEGDPVIIVSSYDEHTSQSTVETMRGLEGLWGKFLRVAGMDPVGMKFPIRGEAKEEMLEKSIQVQPGGLYELSAHEIPKIVCKAIEKLIDLEQIYGMGIAKGDRLYGNVVIMTREGRKIRYPEIIETYVAEVSIAMQRKKLEEKERFLHTLLRHDIKNKIQVIKGYLDLQQEDIPDKDLEYLKKAYRSTDESIELIENVRKLKEIEEEKDIGTVNLKRILKDTISAYESRAEKKGIDVKTELHDVKVKGGRLMSELFDNLIENSLTHSQADKVRITQKKEGDKVLVKIEDDGVGIPEEMREKIFRKDFKLGKNARSGLGLYLVKEIARTYGMEVKVKESEFSGARFDVLIPLLSKGKEE